MDKRVFENVSGMPICITNEISDKAYVCVGACAYRPRSGTDRKGMAGCILAE